MPAAASGNENPKNDGTSRRRRIYIIATQTRAILVDRFPLCFMPKGAPKVPLKIGIFEDLRAAAVSDVSLQHIRIALNDYCTGWSYYDACIAGRERVDLQGSPAGVVSESEAKHALDVVTRGREWVALDRRANELGEEVAFWRTDAIARLWAYVADYEAALTVERYDNATKIKVVHIMPTIAAIADADAKEWHDRCTFCGKFIRPNDPSVPVEDTGHAHAKCAGVAPESAALHGHFDEAETLARAKEILGVFDDPPPAPVSVVQDNADHTAARPEVHAQG